MEFFHLSVLVLAFISSLLVYFVENPVHSILLLIFTFFSSSICIFLFQCEFLGFLFIIVYVGAIAILFLFVVMMLNVKIYKSKKFYLFSSISICALLFVLISYHLISLSFYDIKLFVESSYLIVDFSNNSLYFLGQILFNYFLYNFLIIGLILLLALIGSIVLVFNFNSNKKVMPAFKQLSRSSYVRIYSIK